MDNKTKNIVFAALLAALTCVATMIIKIPSPLKGYINLGDCVVLLSGWVLGPFYGFFAAGIGSALADIISSYFIYAPATFVIKGLMAVVAFKIAEKNVNLSGKILSGIVAEIIMILGYFVFEGFMYGFKASLVNIPANGVQGIAGIVIGVLLIKLFEKNEIINKE